MSGVVPSIMDLDTQVAAWRSGSLAGGASITISDTEPENPRDGMLWFDWSGPRLSIRYDYKTWIELAPNMETPAGPPEVRPPPGPGPGPGPGPTVPWANDLEFSLAGVSFVPPTTGIIPLASLTNWDAAYQADFTDDLLYLGPNRPTSPANQTIRLFATFISQPEYEVDFDAFGTGTAAPNKIHLWGYDSTLNAIAVTGVNSTGNPIQLRITKA